MKLNYCIYFRGTIISYTFCSTSEKSSVQIRTKTSSRKQDSKLISFCFQKLPLVEDSLSLLKKLLISTKDSSL